MKYQLKGKVIDLINKNKPDRSVGFYVKALYKEYLRFVCNLGLKGNIPPFNSIKDCDEINLALLVAFMSDEKNLASVKNSYNDMCEIQRYRNSQRWKHYQPDKHNSRETSSQEKKKREYIQEKMFGGLGMPDDECDAWNYVSSMLNKDSNWTPQQDSCTGFSSDYDDYIHDAYNSLRDEY